MHPSTRSMLLVGAGGAAGALGRWGVAEMMPTESGGFPWATLVVNVVGCILIGIAARRLMPATDRWFLAVTGVLGGFTTFSTFANEVRALADGGHAVLALVYVAASVAAGLIGVELGRSIAR